MNRNDLDKELSQIISDSRKLLGDVEEMDKDELLEMLDDSDQPASSVRQAAFLMLESLVKEFRLRGEYPPQRYVDIANQLRPVENLSHNQNTLLQQARKWVTNLLEGARASSEGRLQVAFHRRDELTEGDRRILEEAEAEVNRKMKRKNE
ncbi:MAG TPA: hypothetical protein VE957_09210 [Terriglobales bacterium]|nr:hypothetical protein [Terriglobales bacterium]